MMNRPRKHDRRHWPDYLNARKKAGGLYYTWRHPSTGKEYGLGYVFAEAAAQAREANLKLLAPPTAKATLADRLTGGGNTMTAWLDRFKIILDQRPGKKKNSDTLTLLGHDSEKTGQIYTDPRGGWVEVKLPRTA